jgi:hypothetical protein
MTREGRASRSHGFVRWLLPASVLHVAGVLLAAALSPGARPWTARATPRLGSLDTESSMELILLDEGQGSTVPSAAPARANPFEAAPATASEPRVAPVNVARILGARAGVESRARREAPSVALAHGADPPRSGLGEPPSSALPEPPQPGSPGLSLAQLGVGTNPFLGIRVEPPTEEERANARLQAALHPPSLERDRQRGLGPAGPVADAARRLVLADGGLVETSAVLNVRVDGSGHVTEVHVLESSNQIQAWQMVAARLFQALNSVALRTASTKHGWDMKLHLASSVRLPSGSAPGMRMGVLGQQVAGSGGPGSTSLELSPTSKLDLEEPIDSTASHLDQPLQFEVMLLKLRADPTDIGAPARRVVEVAVLSIDELAAP